jgi:hypothetical protein
LSEMFVVASRFRSVIAGLSAMAKSAPLGARAAISSPRLQFAQPYPRNPLLIARDRLFYPELSKYIIVKIWRCGHQPRSSGVDFARFACG